MDSTRYPLPGAVKGGLITAAIGSLFAFVPVIIGLIAAAGRDGDDEAITFGFSIQAIGCLIMFIGLLIAGGGAGRVGIRGNGLKFAGWASFVGIFTMVAFAILGIGEVWAFNINFENLGGWSGLCMGLGVILCVLMTIALGQVASKIANGKLLFVAFLILFVFIIVYSLIWGFGTYHDFDLEDLMENYWEDYSYNYYYDSYWDSGSIVDRDLAPILHIALAAAATFTLFCWWRLAFGKSKVEWTEPGTMQYAQVGIVSTVAAPVQQPMQPTYQAQPMQQMYQPQQPMQPIQPMQPVQQAQPTQPVLSDDIRSELMSKTDEQLQQIISNPTMFMPAVVNEAKQIMQRRTAWNIIKDYEDIQLINIVFDAPQGMYALDIIEAASMELYSRQSPLFGERLQQIDSNTVSAICNGTMYAPEGIRRALEEIK